MNWVKSNPIKYDLKFVAVFKVFNTEIMSNLFLGMITQGLVSHRRMTSENNLYHRRMTDNRRMIDIISFNV